VKLRPFEPPDRARRHHRGFDGLTIGRSHAIERKRPMVPRVAVLAEHHHVFGRLKAALGVVMKGCFSRREEPSCGCRGHMSH
jgi:hypothetical protein